MTAEKLCLIAAGLFFLTGLLTGVWKFGCIMRSPEGISPTYVDIAHRAALLYAFACLLLREFVPYSVLTPEQTRLTVGVTMGLFASAVLTYVVHGALGDTDNQLRRPFTLGRWRLRPALVWAYMLVLIVGEVGGFGVLLWGALRS